MATQAVTVLCIGGLDPSGGAGILADARACQAFGCQPLCVATAIVPQNSRGVKGMEPVQAALLELQILALLEDIAPQAIKVGLVPGPATAAILRKCLSAWRGRVPIVMDPVLGPSSGPVFNTDRAVLFLRRQLYPLADLLTPNLGECGRLTGILPTDTGSMEEQAIRLAQLSGARAVLMKGGHLQPDTEAPVAVDILWNGEGTRQFSAQRVSGYEVRGTGCLLASAIASNLAQGQTLVSAVSRSKEWLTRQIQQAIILGSGQRLAPGLLPGPDANPAQPN